MHDNMYFTHWSVRTFSIHSNSLKGYCDKVEMQNYEEITFSIGAIQSRYLMRKDYQPGLVVRIQVVTNLEMHVWEDKRLNS